MTNPTRIEFARGSYGAVAQGHVTLEAPQHAFTVDVRAGQTMIITFTGAGTMRGSVSGPGEGGDGPYYGTGDSYLVPADGLATISAGANTMAEDWTGGFTLAVLVTNPTATPQ
jgi:hypothetical protein